MARRLRVIKSINEPAGSRANLRALRGYLNQQEPGVVRLLHDTWNAQQSAIKYQDLRDAIIAGTLTVAQLEQWQQDYARLVNEKLAPKWMDAMESAAKHEDIQGFEFDPAWEGTRRWVDEHGAELVKNMSNTQQEALKQMIQRAASMGEFGPDELARVIRPLVGLTDRQAIAVQRYYEAQRKDGVKAVQARKRAMNYAARAHRYRAQRIARTELSFAYNQGGWQGIIQAQSQGLMGPVEKTWLTSEDDRVCELCRPNDNVTVGQYEMFPGGFKLPPAHPHCRCSVRYDEVKRAMKMFFPARFTTGIY